MKIVHLCDYIQPQLGYQEFYLAREHAAMGHDVTVVASDRYFPFPDYDRTVRAVLGDRVVGTGETDCEGFRILRLGTSFEVGTKVWLRDFTDTIRRLRPELVICHGMSDFNAVRIAGLKRRLGFRLVYDDHGLFSERKTGMTGWLFYHGFPFSRVRNAADRLVGVAEQCVDFAVELYGFPRNRLEMIPLGADSDLFQFDAHKRAAFRAEHGIADDEVVVTYTGKLTALKGPGHLLTAARMLGDRLRERVVLLFVGNMAADYEATFEAERAALEASGAPARVVRIPAVKNAELVSVYSASDLAAWPRQGSMSMIEAASCSVPIICCDFLTERYKNANGIGIVEDDLDCLCEALWRLVTDADLRQSMGRRGRQLVEEELSWRAVAKRFLE